MLAIKVDLRQAQRALGDVGKQVPFATSLALNALAGGVRAEGTAAVDETFATPTKFTENAFRTVPATKARLVATVAAKNSTNDTGGQDAYLAPYVLGGDRALGKKRGMIVPKPGRVALNAFGNLTKAKLKVLKGKPNVFVGPLRTKNGTVSGVWQGPNGGKRQRNGPAQGMKLLIVFKDTTRAPKHLPFEERARTYVARHAQPVFVAALSKALTPRQR